MNFSLINEVVAILYHKATTSSDGETVTATLTKLNKNGYVSLEILT